MFDIRQHSLDRQPSRVMSAFNPALCKKLKLRQHLWGKFKTGLDRGMHFLKLENVDIKARYY